MHPMLPMPVLPGANDRRSHRALPCPQDMDAHRITSQLHAEAHDVRKPDDKVKLVKVDDDQCDLLLERLANAQEHANLALRRLERPIPVHDLQVVGCLVHRDPMSPHETGVHEGHAGSSVIETHGLGPRPSPPQECRDLEQAVA